MKLTSIVAMARNRVIGKDNKLPWHIPEDLKFFKEKTKGHVMIMGRKTFDSIGKPLPGRFHIIITRNETYKYNDPMVEVVSNVEQALELAHMLTTKYAQKFGDEVFIVGGAEIFAQSMDLIHRLYLTVIEQDFEGDILFPEFKEEDWKLVEKIERPGPPPFSFRTYEK